MTFDPVTLEVCWNRLIAVVNEQAAALQRTSFSSVVREAGDLSAGIFDRRGHMVAQAVTGTPGHINSTGARRSALSRRVSDGEPPSRRRAGDQRSMEDVGTSLRRHDLCTGVPRAGLRRAVRVHLPHGGYRRTRLFRPGTRCVRGRPVHPDREALRGGTAERDAHPLRPDQHAPARPGPGRLPRAGGGRRRRRPATRGVHGRVRAHAARAARRSDPGPHRHQGAQTGLGRRRSISRRARSGDRLSREDGGAMDLCRAVRPHARARARPLRREAGRGVDRRGDAAAHQGGARAAARCACRAAPAGGRRVRRARGAARRAEDVERDLLAGYVTGTR